MKRAFISFDYDYDQRLRDFIVGQSRNPDTPFEIADWSVKKPFPERSWEQRVFEKISKCDVFIVMVGLYTYRCKGVLKEIQMAKDDMFIKKYNFEALVKTVYEYFENLGQTYKNSNLTIKRVLLGSIFAEKLAWSYSGISNRKISPLYQAIRAFDTGGVAVCEPNVGEFEPRQTDFVL